MNSPTQIDHLFTVAYMFDLFLKNVNRLLLFFPCQNLVLCEVFIILKTVISLSLNFYEPSPFSHMNYSEKNEIFETGLKNMQQIELLLESFRNENNEGKKEKLLSALQAMIAEQKLLIAQHASYSETEISSLTYEKMVEFFTPPSK